jgi:hypothetical protein
VQVAIANISGQIDYAEAVAQRLKNKALELTAIAQRKITYKIRQLACRNSLRPRCGDKEKQAWMRCGWPAQAAEPTGVMPLSAFSQRLAEALPSAATWAGGDYWIPGEANHRSGSLAPDQR